MIRKEKPKQPSRFGIQPERGGLIFSGIVGQINIGPKHGCFYPSLTLMQKG
jgi:hypothetical protein